LPQDRIQKHNKRVDRRRFVTVLKMPEAKDYSQLHMLHQIENANMQL